MSLSTINISSSTTTAVTSYPTKTTKTLHKRTGHPQPLYTIIIEETVYSTLLIRIIGLQETVYIHCQISIVNPSSSTKRISKFAIINTIYIGIPYIDQITFLIKIRLPLIP